MVSNLTKMVSTGACLCPTSRSFTPRLIVPVLCHFSISTVSYSRPRRNNGPLSKVPYLNCSLIVPSCTTTTAIFSLFHACHMSR